MSDDQLRQICDAAVHAAAQEWNDVVRDVLGSERIEAYHRTSGAGWALNDDTYELSDYWCTAFIGYLYSVVGDYIVSGQCVDVGLREPLGRDLFPSTLRLCGRWTKTWSDYEGVKEPEIIDPKHTQTGDILIEATGRTDRVYGDHGAIARGEAVTDVEQPYVPMYAGNDVGRLGDGSHGEGVIEGRVPFSRIGTILRPNLTWFVGSWLED